jgi:hypothetical protein
MKVHMICNKYVDLYVKLDLNYTEVEELVVIDHKQQPTLLTSICRSLVRRPTL